VRLRRQLHANRITGFHDPPHDNDTHRTGLANHIALCVTIHRGLFQALLVVIQLTARIAQFCHCHNARVADEQPRPDRQTQQINASDRNVLTHLARRDIETAGLQFIDHLRLQEVHLPEIGTGGICAHQVPVPDSLPHVGITLNTQAGNKSNGLLCLLAE